MMWRSGVVIASCVLAMLVSDALADPAQRPQPDRAPSPVARFAIVIGNNAPERAGTAALHFADDDALATHRLLGEAGVHSVLLARLDDTTAQLHPEAHSDGLPRLADLRAAFDQLAGEMRRERAAGRDVELMLFYSGHGDVAHGEGYVLLEDGHLTRSGLAALLSRSPATRNHVIIDACKSYFMAFAKGPGGRRVPFAGGFVDQVSDDYLATTGFVLSTSSDRESHEWDRFGGGVFSHEVRSALRGAADADGDGRISYAELGAFLATAGQAIANPRLRPDFLIRPPGGQPGQLSDTLLGWDDRPTSAVVLDQSVGHVYIETAAGERVLDAHVVPSEHVTLRLPDERPLFVRSDDASGHEHTIRDGGLVRISELVDAPLSIIARGAESVAFEQLFSIPFGGARVRQFTARWADSDALFDRAPQAQTRWSAVAGATAVVACALTVGGSGLMIERYETGKSQSQAERFRINGTLHEMGIATAVAASVAIASGAIWLYATTRHDGDAALVALPFAGGAPGFTAAIARTW